MALTRPDHRRLSKRVIASTVAMLEPLIRAWASARTQQVFDEELSRLWLVADRDASGPQDWKGKFDACPERTEETPRPREAVVRRALAVLERGLETARRIDRSADDPRGALEAFHAFAADGLVALSPDAHLGETPLTVAGDLHAWWSAHRDAKDASPGTLKAELEQFLWRGQAAVAAAVGRA